MLMVTTYSHSKQVGPDGITRFSQGFVQRISTPFSNSSKGLKLYATELGELGQWDMASMSGILAAGQADSGSHLSPQRYDR